MKTCGFVFMKTYAYVWKTYFHTFNLQQRIQRKDIFLMIAFAVNTTYQNHIMITGGNVYFYSMKKSQRMMVHTYLKRVYDIATVTLFMIHIDLSLHVRMAGYSNIKYSDEIKKKWSDSTLF